MSGAGEQLAAGAVPPPPPPPPIGPLLPPPPEQVGQEQSAIFTVHPLHQLWAAFSPSLTKLAWSSPMDLRSSLKLRVSRPKSEGGAFKPRAKAAAASLPASSNFFTMTGKYRSVTSMNGASMRWASGGGALSKPSEKALAASIPACPY